MWMWRRTVRVKWTDRIRNKIVFEKYRRSPMESFIRNLRFLHGSSHSDEQHWMAGLYMCDNEPSGSLKAIFYKCELKTNASKELGLEVNSEKTKHMIMSQFDSEGIPNQAPETNKPMILNGPTSRNREGSDQSVNANLKQTCVELLAFWLDVQYFHVCVDVSFCFVLRVMLSIMLGFADKSDGITVFRISTMMSLMLHLCRTGSISLQSTEISETLPSVVQTITCTAAMTAIEPFNSFVPISLQCDVIVVHRSGAREQRRLTSQSQQLEISALSLGFSEPTHARHHAIRELIAKSLPSFYEVHQEVHCLAKDGSSRRVDIIAIDRRNDRAIIIIDPTVRFETAVEQTVAVHEENKTIYDPTIQCFRDYYHIQGQIEVFGLLFGARGTIPKFSVECFNSFGIPLNILKIIAIDVVKYSVQILRNHLYT
ncbi:hypothetical protein ANN_06954 [Periplaneta americana]|uniref:Uncharacterized protein n=1 Tax=Periplaneta americana TaxID=6978 RepID=A0ABQ8TEX3_PERAM|nr:hypothetical protein ANN_06954 [Periplaneta americana]